MYVRAHLLRTLCSHGSPCLHKEFRDTLKHFVVRLVCYACLMLASWSEVSGAIIVGKSPTRPRSPPGHSRPPVTVVPTCTRAPSFRVFLADVAGGGGVLRLRPARGCVLEGLEEDDGARLANGRQGSVSCPPVLAALVRGRRVLCIGPTGGANRACCAVMGFRGRQETFAVGVRAGRTHAGANGSYFFIFSLYFRASAPTPPAEGRRTRVPRGLRRLELVVLRTAYVINSLTDTSGCPPFLAPRLCGSLQMRTCLAPPYSP